MQKIDYQIVDRREGEIAICYADVMCANEMQSWQVKILIQDMFDGNWMWGMLNK